jgi:hypothetical protein
MSKSVRSNTIAPINEEIDLEEERVERSGRFTCTLSMRWSGVLPFYADGLGWRESPTHLIACVPREGVLLLFLHLLFLVLMTRGRDAFAVFRGRIATTSPVLQNTLFFSDRGENEIAGSVVRSSVKERGASYR